MSKKLLAVLFTMLLAVAFTACGGDDGPKKPQEDPVKTNLPGSIKVERGTSTDNYTGANVYKGDTLKASYVAAGGVTATDVTLTWSGAAVTPAGADATVTGDSGTVTITATHADYNSISRTFTAQKQQLAGTLTITAASGAVADEDEVYIGYELTASFAQGTGMPATGVTFKWVLAGTDKTGDAAEDDKSKFTPDALGALVVTAVHAEYSDSEAFTLTVIPPPMYGTVTLDPTSGWETYAEITATLTGGPASATATNWQWYYEVDAATGELEAIAGATSNKFTPVVQGIFVAAASVEGYSGEVEAEAEVAADGDYDRAAGAILAFQNSDFEVAFLGTLDTDGLATGWAPDTGWTLEATGGLDGEQCAKFTENNDAVLTGNANRSPWGGTHIGVDGRTGASFNYSLVGNRTQQYISMWVKGTIAKNTQTNPQMRVVLIGSFNPSGSGIPGFFFLNDIKEGSVLNGRVQKVELRNSSLPWPTVTDAASTGGEWIKIAADVSASTRIGKVTSTASTTGDDVAANNRFLLRHRGGNFDIMIDEILFEDIPDYAFFSE